MTRILTALALIPLAVWVVLFAGPWPFLAVLAAVACLCYREYDGIAAAFGFGHAAQADGQGDLARVLRT